jgi:hypothetical protein
LPYDISQSTQAYGQGQRRNSIASKPIGLFSPNATSTALSVYGEDGDTFGNNNAPAHKAFSMISVGGVAFYQMY